MRLLLGSLTRAAAVGEVAEQTVTHHQVARLSKNRPVLFLGTKVLHATRHRKTNMQKAETIDRLRRKTINLSRPIETPFLTNYQLH